MSEGLLLACHASLLSFVVITRDVVSCIFNFHQLGLTYHHRHHYRRHRHHHHVIVNIIKNEIILLPYPYLLGCATVGMVVCGRDFYKRLESSNESIKNTWFFPYLVTKKIVETSWGYLRTFLRLSNINRTSAGTSFVFPK